MVSVEVTGCGEFCCGVSDQMLGNRELLRIGEEKRGLKVGEVRGSRSAETGVQGLGGGV